MSFGGWQLISERDLEDQVMEVDQWLTKAPSGLRSMRSYTHLCDGLLEICCDERAGLEALKICSTDGTIAAFVSNQRAGVDVKSVKAALNPVKLALRCRVSQLVASRVWGLAFTT